MKSQLDEDISSLSISLKNEEEIHKKKIWKFRMAIKAFGSNFANLENEINQVGENFIRVGEQLERVAKEKSRSEEIKELVDYFAEFNAGKHDLIDQLKDNGSEGQIKAKKNIEKYSEEFEKVLLDNFELAYKDKDIKKMSISARTLVAFNGGLSVAKAYINQHPFFLETMIGESHANIAEASYKSLEGVSDILGLPPPPDRWLVQMFNDTNDMVEKDWNIISSVFPNPVYLLQMLIKRVFEQTVQSYLDNLLTRAEKSSPIAFLRVLCSSHYASSQLVEKLKKFDILVVTPTCVSLEAAQQLAISHNAETIDFLGARANNFLESSDLLASKYRVSDTRNSSIFNRDNANKNDQYNDNLEMTQAVAAMMTGANRLLKASKDFANNREHLNSRNNIDLDDPFNNKITSNSTIASDPARSYGNHGVLQISLDRCRDDLFVAHLGGGRYIKAEREFLESAFQKLIEPFLQSRLENKNNTTKQGGIFSIFSAGNGNNNITTSNPSNQANNHGNLANIITGSSGSLNQSNQNLRSNFSSSTALNQFFSSSPNNNNTPNQKTNNNSLQPNSSKGLKHSNTMESSKSFKRNSPLLNASSTFDDQSTSHLSILSVKTVVEIMFVHSESISRSIELSKPIDLQTTVHSLFRTLLDFLKKEYLFIGLNDVTEYLSHDPKTEPNIELSLYCVDVVSKIVGLVHNHYTCSIAPILANSSNHLLREIITDKNEFVVAIEKKSNDLVNKIVSTSVAWISFNLAKQKKTDFRPSDHDLDLDFGTPACNMCTDFLAKIEAQCRVCLDLNNQIRILTELGNSLYKDVSKYIEIIEKFGIPELTEKFQTLQILAKIFSVPESTLKSLFEEGLLARLDRSVVTSYIQMREDFKSSLLSKLNF
ncbi:Exocyst complex component SEC10 [Smittium culicis]|uniref:Exocyst complex component SEC10 n=2 Tax=Smittium culicis TaxID=133412 RepID=A0A1R1XLB9_9FUNG|nr:Exocyst complex component SEC10 [Smittium culicis]